MNHYVSGYLAVMQVGTGAGAANDRSGGRGALSDSSARFAHRLVSLAYRAGEAGGRIRRRVNAWVRERRAVRELERLDDRTLADIGVRRGEIRRVVRELGTGVTPRRVHGVVTTGASRPSAANEPAVPGRAHRGAA